jgi:hypothetical protein
LLLLQDSPGQAFTLQWTDHLTTLLTFVLQQQKKDYDQLNGGRGLTK